MNAYIADKLHKKYKGEKNEAIILFTTSKLNQPKMQLS